MLCFYYNIYFSVFNRFLYFSFIIFNDYISYLSIFYCVLWDHLTVYSNLFNSSSCILFNFPIYFSYSTDCSFKICWWSYLFLVYYFSNFFFSSLFYYYWYLTIDSKFVTFPFSYFFYYSIFLSLSFIAWY
jgi:hypothetical protein